MAVRSEHSERAILEATMSLLDDQSSSKLTVKSLSIERIAKEAGVSKTTIYRWWPSKAAVVIDTFLENHIARTPVRDDIPAIQALKEHLASLAAVYATHEGNLVAQLIAECQYDEKTMQVFKERFWAKRQEATTNLIRRAIEEGSIRKGPSPSLVAELLYAPIYFRLLLQNAPLEREFAAQIIELAFSGLQIVENPE